MEWFISCFFNEELLLREIYGTEKTNGLSLFIHLNKCVNRHISSILDIKMSGIETFQFEGEFFQSVAVKNELGYGSILVISDSFVRAQVFDSVLNQLNAGIQIFDQQGRLVYLNDTCKQIESLIKENVVGKHLRDIYDVDENYSTILTTIKNKKPVNDRCDTFANRLGDAVISINSGYPLYLEDHFYGAFGVVLDMENLAGYEKKRKLMLQHIEKQSGRPIHRHHRGGYYTFERILGKSEGMQNAVNIAQKVAASDFSVLLLGETGVGKEMFAQSIHSASTRSSKAFIAINCAAIPSSILESTLFGTVKGSFTGSGNMNGLLDEANGGTLFLDEINSMDIQVQSKLLRVLQEKMFRRVGGLKDIHCDFRVVAAMNESPAAAIENNRLRNDLYYRINTISIEIPPLRERAEDIPHFVSHYIDKMARTGGKHIAGVSEKAMKMLLRYDWPGNVRELFHALDYAITMTDSGILDAGCFPQRMLLDETGEENGRQLFLHGDIHEKMLLYERKLISEALEASGGNVSRAAKSLNISRQSLQHRIKKCGIQRLSTDDTSRAN